MHAGNNFLRNKHESHLIHNAYSRSHIQTDTHLHIPQFYAGKYFG